MIKVAIKAILTLMVAGSAGRDPLFKTGILGTVYLLISYYMWYWNLRGGFFKYIRRNGFSMAMFSAGFMFLLPALPLTILAIIMKTGNTADTIISVALDAAGLGCFLMDYAHACRLIK